MLRIQWLLTNEVNCLNEIYLLVKEYLQPELVWFVPFLYILGRCIKKSVRIDDTLIPDVLVVVGIALSGLVGLSKNSPVTWMEWVILVSVSIGQGGVLASLAVLCNQIIKQHVKANNLKGLSSEEESKDE
jgi:hypothetical protein